MQHGKYQFNRLIDWKKAWIDGADLSDTKTVVLAQARTLYIPIPKAANSSVKRALYPTLGLEADPKIDVHRDRRIPTLPLSEALKLAEDDWFIFTIVRDPFDRSLSAWTDKVLRKRVENQRSLRRMGLQPDDSHATLLSALRGWPPRLLNDHFMPQSMLSQRALATGRLSVFHFETLNTDWPEISRRITANGGPNPAPLPHLNTSRADYSTAFTPQETKLITAIYRNDLETFGYSTQRHATNAEAV
ncbi:sulfotransferase family 2 domain-containing protein [Pseudoruegeria sp. SK021]|uniref:sulfotransferase family 2 domain-containing protein n=1 Tax=Pseudoruegeria sp. SK021 TaxID=1933035 RepID=UPI000A22A13F|nr:sulfotransferase family 2 domain-containing protein [Pseudoruegeria sp. SK021]OSP54488.1 hypothetical protein BV911_12190 [Pseudoruegeria sp. SK021]